MQPGDRIAVKAAFVKKHNLPFDNRGRPVSCMRIKAIGTVTDNFGDGRTVKVDWEPLEPPRDWYFYTYRAILDPLSQHAEGVMLHPAIDADIDEIVCLQGHDIRFITVDLAKPTAEILERISSVSLPVRYFTA